MKEIIINIETKNMYDEYQKLKVHWDLQACQPNSSLAFNRVLEVIVLCTLVKCGVPQ